MKVTSSYAVEIKKQKTFDDTINLYREAVSFLINCLNNEWPYIQATTRTFVWDAEHGMTSSAT